MKNKSILYLSILISLSACVPSITDPLQAENALPSESPAKQTAVPTEETNINSFEFPTPIVGTVALNFSERPCSASWSNNGEYLPCPGKINAITNGYAEKFDQIMIEGKILINQEGLLTIPAQKESGFSALFGKYPPFTVQSGDHFRAVLACADAHPACDVNFSLEYYNSDNTISQINGAKWNKKYDPEGTFIYADANLDSLAGKTIQFLLSIRDNGSADDDYAVWVNPHIARLSGGTDAIPPNDISGADVDRVNISGAVDMRTAPPYLFDDHPPGSLSSIVLFDGNSDMFFTTQTQPDDLSFSFDVYPGQYFLAAFSYGVGEVPYVTGAYTGVDPSCGQPMAVLTVLPDSPLSNIIINDWNWSCGGTASRVEKPEEVSLP